MSDFRPIVVFTPASRGKRGVSDFGARVAYLLFGERKINPNHIEEKGATPCLLSAPHHTLLAFDWSTAPGTNLDVTLQAAFASASSYSSSLERDPKCYCLFLFVLAMARSTFSMPDR
jgi:hypothetical protein